MARVDLLLATFDSEAFLGPLLASLAAQTVQDFRLLVSDEGSRDGTLALLEAHRPHFADMRIVRRDTPSGSAKANFASLLEMSDADYALFVDADDIWDADKVAVTLERLTACEARHGRETPAYVFSDARIVDGAGRVVHDSFWHYKRMHPSAADSAASYLVCPPMLGCLSGINRALRDLGTPVPVDAVTGHDWWLLLLAKFAGTVGVIDRPTASYRLHGNNASNQRPVDALAYAAAPGRRNRVRRGLELRRRQAEAVLERCGDALPREQRDVLAGFASLDRMGPLEKRAFLLRKGALYPDWQRNVAMLLAA